MSSHNSRIASSFPQIEKIVRPVYRALHRIMGNLEEKGSRLEALSTLVLETYSTKAGVQRGEVDSKLFRELEEQTWDKFEESLDLARRKNERVQQLYS